MTEDRSQHPDGFCHPCGSWLVCDCEHLIFRKGNDVITPKSKTDEELRLLRAVADAARKTQKQWRYNQANDVIWHRVTSALSQYDAFLDA